MPCFNMIRVVGLLALIATPVFAQDASLGPMPRVLDERLKLELFAEHPTLVTPTGIDVDHLGRVWVLESNTHFPPDGYQGHPSDRLLVLQDTDGDGQADRTTVFADGFKFAMSVAVQPVWLEVGESGSAGVGKEEGKDKPRDSSNPRTPELPHPHTVFVATRGEIVRLRDTNNDLVADERTRLVHLETAGNYPHNGLAGIAFDALGWMYFGFGENLGADYKIIGSDGVTLSGGGEGGNMYRCRPDGSKLERWATGFWNPHASCFDAFGRLFTVDNDPDSRPPCRLLHIIPGGDYGYRFRNGRRGTHPFTAWNGEIPGTLPMVSGTGEAPSGILCYESDGFPADYLGTLLVGSWGDHRIDQFVLEPKGASFVSKPKPIVQGTENFRPVGLALAPDGSIYFSDWVLRDYKLHRKGRVWRLSANEQHDSSAGEYAKLVRSQEFSDATKLIDSSSLNARRIASRILSREEQGCKILKHRLYNTLQSQRFRIEALWALMSRPEAKLTDLWKGERDSWRLLIGVDDVMAAVFSIAKETKSEIPGHDSFSADVRTLFLVDNSNDPQIARYLGGWLQWFAPPNLLYTHSIWGEIHERSMDPVLNRQAMLRLHSMKTKQGDITASDINRRMFSSEEGARPGERWYSYFALRWRMADPRSIHVPKGAIESFWPDVRFLAVQWIGEEKLVELRPDVERLLSDPKTSTKLVMACLATLSLLDGVPPAEFEKTPPVTQLMKIVADDKRPAALRATALTMVPASTAELSTKLLLEFAKSGDALLKTQAVRTLQQSGRAEGIPLLLEIAADENADTSLRLDAIAGLCATPHDQPLPANIEQFLLDALNNRLRFRAASTDASQCRLEAIRALRGRGVPGSKIGEALRAGRETASGDRELAEALDLAIEGKSSLSSSDPQTSTLNSQPSPDSGRRVFYHHQGPLCFKCHTVNGRGGNVGPDLSVIARTMNREKLLGSILEPSKEISPQFLTWTILTDDGKTHTGIMVTENGGGDIELGDIQGNITKIPRKTIEERTPSNVSVMPQGLHQRMTSRELTDLLDYLETLK